MTSAAELVSPFLDLRLAPFTMPGSRLLVTDDGWLHVSAAEYEQDPVPLARLRLLKAGSPVPLTRATPHRLEFGQAARLTFDGPDALSIMADAPGLEVAYQITGQPVEHFPLTHGFRIAWIGGRPSVGPSPAHDGAEAASKRMWSQWFAKCPAVREDLAPMAAYCWWVLAANTVHLAHTGSARVVVPSKLGYMGLWQWDAYFIAIGLRHGDMPLAREQLSLAFRFATPDGQLPDVVHDGGVLSSSDDLPPGDVARLSADGSTTMLARVPLTKPPLAAWAVRKLEEIEPDARWLSAVLPAVRASQEWWFRAGEASLPVYDHPYSSGLDNSPVFDAPLPVTTPDLAAYLVVQDQTLAAMLAARGDEVSAAACRKRAERTLGRLLGLWHQPSGIFKSITGDARHVAADTVLGLLPLFTGRLPTEQADQLVAALDDPQRFGGAWRVPTVSRCDPSFNPNAMWRGPVWLNTNALLIEGLQASGYPERARELAEQTLAMVQAAGGPYEYFNPDTAARPPHAVPMFSWTAALFIDLAVRVSH